MIEVKASSVGRMELTDFVQEQLNAGWELKTMVPYLFKSHTVIKHPESDQVWSQAEGYTVLFTREAKPIAQNESTGSADATVITRKRK